MSETDFAAFEGKTSSDRTVMHILYGLHTVSPFSGLSLSVVALIVNYIKRSDEHDAVYASHHNYMIATFWWTVLWLVVSSPLWMLFIVPGAIAWTVVVFWYLYRCIRGWVRFNDGKTPY